MLSGQIRLPRYLRVVNSQTLDCDQISVENEDQQLRIVQWLPSFRTLPGCLPLAALQETYGKDHVELGLYPMDISSALPVLALELSLDQPLKVLDLCCCPGGKLQFISERINPSQSLVVGIDIAVSRLHTCKSLLDKWRSVSAESGGNRARQLLFHADGQSFAADQLGTLLYDTKLAESEDSFRKGRKNANKSSRKRELQQLRDLQANLSAVLPSHGYDRVLVDAECTHDASYRHMQFFGNNESGQKRKWQKRSHDDLEDDAATTTETGSMLLSHNITSAIDPTSDQEQRHSLQSLQRGLLQNGFKSLRPGGLLIYSTCSADTAQNEDIVHWLLTEHTDAELLPALPQFVRTSREEAKTMMDSLLAMPIEQQASKICEFYASRTTPILLDGELPGTIRIDTTCGMSGHFIAKIRKKDS